MIGKLICRILGKHLRGVKGEPYMTADGKFQESSCPRCGRKIVYKVREKL